MEPPLVSPAMYQALPLLTKYFKKVMVHNTVGEHYGLQNVDRTRLHKLHWPQPYEGPLNAYFDIQDRLNKLVVISGAHNPRFRKPELYSQRIEAVAQLQKFDAIDLYGRGWDKTFSRHNAWLPFWKNRRKLANAYRGMCDSKMEVLSKYRFSLCFENMPMLGYITEKIFDCFYAGTVPVYWGASDIEKYIPQGCYIRFDGFQGFTEMWHYLANMPIEEWQDYRAAIKEYLSSSKYLQHFHAMENMMGVSLGCHEK
jgi:alpha(1,3/1,4) fucosyltransferase